MPRETPTTPLLALLRACTEGERERLATLAGTEVNYLYALAGCHRAQPKFKLGHAIVRASDTLHEETKGRTPRITADQLATMCDVAGLNG